MTDMKGAVLVIGGGIAGMQSALDLADSGYRIYLVEKTPAIGGFMAKLDKTFPTNDCAMCIMAPKLVAVGRHHNITIITNATVEQVEGEEGDFKVKVLKKARYVDEEKCTGCGICIQKCPKKVSAEFEHHIAKRKAIYLPYLQAVPNVPTIDAENCIFMTKGKCGACKKFCEADSVDFEQKDETLDLEVGSIIVATGFEAFDPGTKGELGFGVFKNVVSSAQFERILNASGPFGGHIQRPSDGEEPRKVAFIQCCGSRDTQPGSSKYCSSVCCMYALKEAVIAKEHLSTIEPTVFYIDLRTFGKEFEDYRNRAAGEWGLNLVKARVSDILETSDDKLEVKYVENGNAVKDIFDMVVLAVGLQAPPEMEGLADVLGIDLDERNHVKTSDFKPMSSSVPGIYACGASVSPKDIPDTVAQSSGAAAMATATISSARGTLAVKKEYPDEIEVAPSDSPRIGVFVCHCGINIGSVVNVPEVMEYAKGLDGVVFAMENTYTCSADTQEKIIDLIKEHNLNRVVVASCTPRTHEPLFQNTIRDGGLNPYLFEMANIREHCSWVHQKDKPSATEKAKDLVRMAVSKSRLSTPLEKMKLKVNNDALVIGGGVSGLTAAKGLADQGFLVHLIEKEEELGGNLRRLHFLASGTDPQESLKELISDVGSDKNINIHKGTTIENIQGYVGNFETRFVEGGQESNIKHGVVIVATGANEYSPKEHLYGEDPRVVTQLALEEKLATGNLDAKTVVMMQCVGSRCDEFTNCSRICCTKAVKNSLVIKDKDPDANVFIVHKGIRTYGFKEEHYRKARSRGVHFMFYDEKDPPTVSKDGNDIKVEVLDDILGRKVSIKPDLLVLSAGIRPLDNNIDLAKMLKVPLTKDGFFLEAHMKLRPVDFATEGVFLCGLAHGPKFVDESISQAMGAVARATTILSKDYLEAEGQVSEVDEDACSGCGECVAVCPYNALELVERDVSAADMNSYMPRRVVVAQINPVVCKGCGSCASMCPSQAIDQKGFNTEQIMAMIRNVIM